MEWDIVGLLHLHWLVTESEVRNMIAPYRPDIAIRQFGAEGERALHYLLPGFSNVLPRWAKKPWARRCGWSLWFSGHKV